MERISFSFKCVAVLSCVPCTKHAANILTMYVFLFMVEAVSTRGFRGAHNQKLSRSASSSQEIKYGLANSLMAKASCSIKKNYIPANIVSVVSGLAFNCLSGTRWQA